MILPVAAAAAKATATAQAQETWCMPHACSCLPSKRPLLVLRLGQMKKNGLRRILDTR
jgi:hypothetical protein